MPRARTAAAPSVSASASASDSDNRKCHTRGTYPACRPAAAGGFRGNGFVHSPLLAKHGYTFKPLIHVSDWYATLLGAALSHDDSTARAKAEATLAPFLLAQDSVNQWPALSAGLEQGERNEILLAGIDSDQKGAAIRVGDLKLLVGSWGSPLWCDLNVTGLSPAAPAPSGSNPSAPGGLGGLLCINLGGNNSVAAPLRAAKTVTGGKPKPQEWWSVVTGLYDLSRDPRGVCVHACPCEGCFAIGRQSEGRLAVLGGK